MKKLRVWHIMNLDKEGIGKKSFWFPVESPEEGARLIDAMAKLELSVPENVIGSNVFGLERWDKESEEWYEWENEDGLDVESLVNNLDGGKDA